MRKRNTHTDAHTHSSVLIMPFLERKKQSRHRFKVRWISAAACHFYLVLQYHALEICQENWRGFFFYFWDKLIEMQLSKPLKKKLRARERGSRLIDGGREGVLGVLRVVNTWKKSPLLLFVTWNHTDLYCLTPSASFLPKYTCNFLKPTSSPDNI